MLETHFGENTQKTHRFTSPDMPMNLLSLLVGSKRDSKFEICNHIQIDTGIEGIQEPIHIINYYFENKLVSVFAVPVQNLPLDYWRVCFVDDEGYLMR